MATSRARIQRTQQTSQALQYSSAAASAYLSSLFTGVSIFSTAGLASLVVPVGPALPALGLYLYLNRPRFPQLKPGEIGQSVYEANQLRERGLEPVIVNNPYTGELTIGTKDQPLDILLAARALTTLTPKVDTAPLYEARKQFIEESARTATERGYYKSVAQLPNIPRNLVCGVMRPAPDAPLQYVCRQR